MVNSRDKGKRGEREWAGVLQFHGYDARRGAQYSAQTEDGTPSPDVHCPSLPIHWEVKRTNRLDLRKAIAQAKADAQRAGVEHWVVTWREDNGEWIEITSKNSLFSFIRGDLAGPN